MKNGKLLVGLITGNALGYIVPPLLAVGPVKAYEKLFAESDEKYPKDWANPEYNESEAAIDEVTEQLFWLFLSQAIFALVFFVAVIFLFPAQPKYPPSVAEMKKRKMVSEEKIVGTKGWFEFSV